MSAISHLEIQLEIARLEQSHPVHDYSKRKDLESQARHLVGESVAIIPDPFHPFEPQALLKIIGFCKDAGAVAYDFEIAKYENCLRGFQYDYMMLQEFGKLNPD